MQSNTNRSITHFYGNGSTAVYEPDKNQLTVTLNDESSLEKKVNGENVTEYHGVIDCEFLPGAMVRINFGSMPDICCDPITHKSKDVVFVMSDGRQVHYVPHLDRLIEIGPGPSGQTRKVHENVTNCRMSTRLNAVVEWDQLPPPSSVLSNPPLNVLNAPKVQTVVANVVHQPSEEIQVFTGNSYNPMPPMRKYWYETDPYGRKVLKWCGVKLKTRDWKFAQPIQNQATTRFVVTPI